MAEKRPVMLCPAELAALTGRSVWTVRRWIRTGKLPGVLRLPSGQFAIPAEVLESMRLSRGS
jgi:predicted site-specific integrase-resolvase